MSLYHRLQKYNRALFALLMSIYVVAVYVPARASDRPEQVLNALQQQNQNLSEEDRQTKYCKMSKSPFRFYRGSNHLFWADFANDNRLKQFGNDKTKIWIQGDLHTDNYGAYDDDEGNIVYNLNDFDESVVADYQFDVWRMATSLVLVVHQNNVEENILSSTDIDNLLDAFSEAYLDTVASYRGNDQELDIKFTKSNTYGRLDDFLKKVEDDESRKQLLKKWTDGESQFDISKPNLESVSLAERQAIIQQMANYGQTLTGGLSYNPEHFDVKDVARRINAGLGSLGTPRYYVLIEGDKASEKDDDRILDVKLQKAPTPYAYLTDGDRQKYDQQFLGNHAFRQAVAYRALTKDTDDYLGWMQFDIPDYPDGYYSVRDLSPYKEEFNTTKLKTPERFIKLAEQWGKILATAHARADEDFDEVYVPYSFDKQLDEATDGRHSEFRGLVRTVARSYAEQVEADWQTMRGAEIVPRVCPPD